MTKLEISNSDDVIDSRDVIARIEELETELADAHDDSEMNSVLDMRTELETLKALAEQASGYAPDWEHGEQLIRDSYFEQYAQELAEDCCPFPRNSPEGKALEMWPYRCIDWEQAARELRMDYTAVEFDGVTYWIR